ncbi:MAG TPA: ATP-binding cassette domain-containing protein [Candidatus Dormibacteraeota bacterium]|nr:ATP-binding cassette domain-containing protein [Candidatus Dormibacteraeota bacterium]
MLAERQPPETVISVHQLRRVFKSGKSTVEAVAGIDLEVYGGEIFGFLGPNGAGKTTTLRMLATLLPPTSGEATVVGQDLRRHPAEVRRRIGYVGQRGGADLQISGRSELVFEARLYGMNPAEARRRAAELIDSLELESCAERKISTYSGGQRRRLDVGVGLVHRPQLLFLDEPTTGLDPQSRVRMWDEVRKLRDQGTTVFLTTHYLEEADALCNRLAIIDHGRIVALGTPDELKRAVAGDLVTVGVSGDVEEALRLLQHQPFVREASIDGRELRLYVDRGETATPNILRLLDRAGLGLTTVALSRPSLDDVFLRSTGRSLRESDAA